MRLTVVVCTLDRRASLRQTLDTLAAQRAPGLWEVLVVDNGSSDGSPTEVKSLAADFPVPLRLEREPRRGLSHARNHALQTSRGRALLFLDDDVNCLPGCVAAHLSAFSRPEVVATAGRILPLLPPGAPAWWQAILPHEVGGPTSRYDFGEEEADITAGGSLPPPFGANMGVLREAALEAGGFRSELGWGRRMIPCEETEFFRRVQVQGGRMLYVPGAGVEHRIEERRTTPGYYRRWSRGYGRATVLMEPRRSRLQRIRRAGREARSVLQARLRRLLYSRRSDPVSSWADLRAACVAEGRLLQYLGF